MKKQTLHWGHNQMKLKHGKFYKTIGFSSVQFSHSVVPNSSWPHELQHARLPCPSPTPGVYSNSCYWVDDAIQQSDALSCPSPPGSIFPSIRIFYNESVLNFRGPKYWSFSFKLVLPMNTQDRTLLGWTGWISWQSKGLSRVFSNTTVQKHQFFGAQLS